LNPIFPGGASEVRRAEVNGHNYPLSNNKLVDNYTYHSKIMKLIIYVFPGDDSEIRMAEVAKSKLNSLYKVVLKVICNSKIQIFL
jgi:hypothetical protein